MARSAVVPIRFTVDERDALMRRARESRLSLSEWVRRAVFSRRLPPQAASEVNRETYQELARVGNNLNQLVRAIHRGELPLADSLRLPELERLRTLLKEIGLQVLGVSGAGEAGPAAIGAVGAAPA